MLSRNKSMKWIFQKQIHKTNPWNKSFKKGLRNKSTKQIFWNQYGFANPKPRICMDSDFFKVRLCTKDLLDSWKQVESFENQSTKRIHKPNLLKTLRICEPRYETNPDSFRKAHIEPFWSQDSWSRYETNLWICFCKTNPRFYESLIQFLHPYYYRLYYHIYEVRGLLVCS